MIKLEDDIAVRRQIKTMLTSGVGTEAFPRPEDHENVQDIIRRLQTYRDNLEAKIVIGGFTLSQITHNNQVQVCKTCIYYSQHRRHCVLPELNVPVEPEWSCRLWRI
jgi:hypothetical protein